MKKADSLEKLHMGKVAELPCACCGASGVHVHHIREGQGMGAEKTRQQWFSRRFIESSTGIRCECAVCSKPMWFPKSKAGKYKTCGDECAKQLRSLAKKARERVCATCGVVFVARSYQLSNGHGIYCSQKCNKSAHAAMNSNEAQAKVREAWKKWHEENKFVMVGDKNPRWRGGAQAKKRRDKENGWPWQAARRAKKSNPLPHGFIKKTGSWQKWLCAICKKSIKKNFHADHIMPLYLGGKHEVGNIQLLCPTCNLRKSKKDPIVFMQSMGFLL